MAIAISAQMSSNLVALSSINSDMGTTQDRLSSGKKIASVLDGAGVFFRAKTLTAKAEDLNPVNANINAALSNVKVANKGIDTMYDNLNGLLTSLKDAKAKSIVAATAVNTATIATGATDQRTAYLTAASMIEATPTGTATAGNLAEFHEVPDRRYLRHLLYKQLGIDNDPALLCRRGSSNYGRHSSCHRSANRRQPKSRDGLHRCCGIGERFHGRVR